MDFLKENKTFLITLMIAILCLFLSVGHYSEIYLDVGREMYYPSAILDGKVLYKDIFCIYGPFSYLFNALLYKILGIKLSTLYFAGCACALLIVSFTYFISKKFLNTFSSFAITFFVTITGCLATRIFNFTLPYSYAVLYGLVCFLVSISFLISFIEDKKGYKLIVSSVFCALAIVNKYDFIPFLLPLFFIIFKTKDAKLILKSICAFLFTFFVPFLFLFITGLEFRHLLEAFFDIKAFTNTKALQVFYSTQGVYYSKNLWFDWLFNISNRLICFFVIYIGFNLFEQNQKFLKALGFVVFTFGAFLTFISTKETSYLCLTFMTFLFFIFSFKKNSFKENFFIIAALLVSIKSFWGLSHVNYGLYYVGAVLISFFILLKNNFKTSTKRSFSLIFISMAFAYMTIDLIDLSPLTEKINTNKGYIKTSFSQAKKTNAILSFVDNKENSNIAILPEGLNINFFSKNKTYPPLKYNSLIPLYTEGFGEDKIIDFYNKNKPEYIILINIPMTSYGKNYICESYAQSFCGFVRKNYRYAETFSEYRNTFEIYEKAGI